MTIKAHCMGTEFPKRLSGEQIARCMEQATQRHIAKCNAEDKSDIFDRFLEAWAKKIDREITGVPSAADLDRVAEEQKAKEQTSGKTDRSQP